MFHYEYMRKVFYYETDQMGIVHHSNYIRWLEEARIEYLESVGYPYHRLEGMGLLSPVLSVSCDYFHMIRFGDRVLIKVQLKSFMYTKFAFEYQIEDSVTGKIMTKAFSTHCFVDKKGAPVNLKKSYPEFYDVMVREAAKEC